MVPNPRLGHFPAVGQFCRIDQFDVVSAVTGHQWDTGRLCIHVFRHLEVYGGYANRYVSKGSSGLARYLERLNFDLLPNGFHFSSTSPKSETSIVGRRGAVALLTKVPYSPSNCVVTLS